MKQRKRYAHVRDPKTGKRLLAHRVLAAELLARPLLPGEVVHHRDGDGMNNAPDNLLVLPSQRYHAHLEHHLRREKLGMPSLFPELLQGIQHEPRGTLFDQICALRIKEPPLPRRPAPDRPAAPPPPQPRLLQPREDAPPGIQDGSALAKIWQEGARAGGPQLLREVFAVLHLVGAQDCASPSMSRDLLTAVEDPLGQQQGARAPNRPGSRTRQRVSLEAVESGALDFKTLAEDTRRKLQARHDKGKHPRRARKPAEE